MIILLDTHIFIWLTSEEHRLTPQARALIGDSSNRLLLSIASIWEIQIKAQLGKLTLSLPLPQLVASQRRTNGIQVLPVKMKQIVVLSTLPMHHKDPFDRMLIAQANAEGGGLLSADTIFSLYPVALLG